MSWDIIDKISRYVSKEARSRTTSGKMYEADAHATGTPTIVEVLSSATANTFGSWVEIEDSLSSDSEVCSFVSLGAGAAAASVFEFATGASGSEVVFARITIPGIAGMFTYHFSPRIKIASGSRIAVRVSDTLASAPTYYVSLQWFQGLEAI